MLCHGHRPNRLR